MLCIWSVDGNCGPFMVPYCYEWTVAKFNKNFFPNSCRGVSFAKYDFLIENTARYLKQYLFCVSMQHIPLLLSIILSWSIEGNRTQIVWLFVQHDLGLAVRAPLDPEDSTVVYCCCTFLWHSFMFILLKDSHHFQVGISVLNFCQQSSVRCHVTADVNRQHDLRFVLSGFMGLQ